MPRRVWRSSSKLLLYLRMPHAGLGDIPERFAAGVLSSAIDTSSVFARFLDDQMKNVFHSTTYTQRFKDVT